MCQQAVSEIEGLDCLVNLESLWLCETNITKIKGLENNVKLKKLHLYSNRIRVMENLSHLTDLQTLWLMENEISVIDGVDTLTNLEHLYLSRNRIREIGSSLDYNYNLVELNLAGNLLWSFKDLLNLTRSSSLKKLSFNDPDYGDNPVCDLCNYQACSPPLTHAAKVRSLGNGISKRRWAFPPPIGADVQFSPDGMPHS